MAAAAAVAPIPSAPAPTTPTLERDRDVIPRRVHAPRVPQHPFMAPNGSSLLHEDAWQTDVSRRPGPRGRSPVVTSTLLGRECASVTFDSRGRIVTVCVGLDLPRLLVMDPRTLEVLGALDLPPRALGPGDGLTNFTGGGYFFLDDRDRAVVPTATRHLVVVRVGADAALTVERDVDLSGAVPEGDGIISALPDWDGRLWFVSRLGVVGTVDRSTGRVRTVRLEPNGNSFAVGEHGDVYIVTDAALRRLRAGAGGRPRVVWRRRYENTGVRKPGQTQAGSGTTPTLTRRWVAITDNADPMKVVVLRRADGRRVCAQPVFGRGRGSTDQSLIGAGRSFVVENNFGYLGPASVAGGRSSRPGLARVAVDRDGRGCSVRWVSPERAPSVVPKLSAPTGLLYTYAKPHGLPDDPWYLTALDWRTGRTAFRVLAGAGALFNNHYAPITIGPAGTAYVGVLGGLVAIRDGARP